MITNYSNRPPMFILFFIGCITLFVFISGCFGGEAKVLVEGSWESSSIHLMQNPVTIIVHTTATNVGNIDAKNVQADVVMEYYGREITRDTINYGTVKTGMPIKKDTIMNMQFIPEEFSNFNSEGLGTKIVDVRFNT